MNHILKESEVQYKGTDPLIDSEALYKEKMSKHMLYAHCAETKVRDPFDEYGFGILTYFETLRYLMLAMLICTILFLPVMFTYSSYNVMNSFIDADANNAFTLGNMGQAGGKCIQSYVGIDRPQNINCT